MLCCYIICKIYSQKKLQGRQDIQSEKSKMTPDESVALEGGEEREKKKKEEVKNNKREWEKKERTGDEERRIKRGERL